MIKPGAIGGRIPSLDGWRAIAILLVLGDHAVYTNNFPYAELGWIGRVFDGNLGVRIFFVLSGFLISLLLLEETDRTGGVSLRHFYLRRIFRIFPIYFAYLGVLGVLTLAGLYSDTANSWLGCFTFTRNMIGRRTSATFHFWSLAVEEQFYFIWPILFCGLRLWKRDALYVGALLIPIIACPIIRRYLVSLDLGPAVIDRIIYPGSILVYADSLSVGCLGAWLVWKCPTGGIWKNSYTAILAAALMLLIGMHWAQVVWKGKAVDAIIPGIQAWAILACLWLGADGRSPGYAFLNSKAMITIGLLSYSLYVWHFLFLGQFMGAKFAHWPTHDWKFWLLPALIVSATSYFYLEMPFVSLRKRFRN